jgi:hypothetical protein
MAPSVLVRAELHGTTTTSCAWPEYTMINGSVSWA